MNIKIKDKSIEGLIKELKLIKEESEIKLSNKVLLSILEEIQELKKEDRIIDTQNIKKMKNKRIFDLEEKPIRKSIYSLKQVINYCSRIILKLNGDTSNDITEGFLCLAHEIKELKAKNEVLEKTIEDLSMIVKSY